MKQVKAIFKKIQSNGSWWLNAERLSQTSVINKKNNLQHAVNFLYLPSLENDCALPLSALTKFYKPA